MTKNIQETFSVLSKYESESDEKEKKFWTEIWDVKLPLGNILNESKQNIFLNNKIIIIIFYFNLI